MTEEKNNQNFDLGEIKEKVEEKLSDTAEKAVEFAKEVKKEYEESSPETKEKIKKTAMYAGAGLGVLAILKKIFGKK